MVCSGCICLLVTNILCWALKNMLVNQPAIPNMYLPPTGRTQSSQPYNYHFNWSFSLLLLQKKNTRPRLPSVLPARPKALQEALHLFTQLPKGWASPNGVRRLRQHQGLRKSLAPKDAHGTDGHDLELPTKHQVVGILPWTLKAVWINRVGDMVLEFLLFADPNVEVARLISYFVAHGSTFNYSCILNMFKL